MSNREIAAELLEQNVDTIEAMKEIDNMIKTGSGQHFEGSTEDFMRMMLQNWQYMRFNNIIVQSL